MNEKELITFAQHIRAHCLGCRNIKPGKHISSCVVESCLLHRIRLLSEIFESRPNVLQQLLVGTRRPEEKVTNTSDRKVG